MVECHVEPSVYTNIEVLYLPEKELSPYTQEQFSIIRQICCLESNYCDNKNKENILFVEECRRITAELSGACVKYSILSCMNSVQSDKLTHFCYLWYKLINEFLSYNESLNKKMNVLQWKNTWGFSLWSSLQNYTKFHHWGNNGVFSLYNW